MLSIKVLGPGCARCDLLKQRAMQALEMLAEEEPALEATILHVSDYKEISWYPVMFTPALVINEKVVSAGYVPTVSRIKTWMREALDGAHHSTPPQQPLLHGGISS